MSNFDWFCRRGGTSVIPREVSRFWINLWRLALLMGAFDDFFFFARFSGAGSLIQMIRAKYCENSLPLCAEAPSTDAPRLWDNKADTFNWVCPQRIEEPPRNDKRFILPLHNNNSKKAFIYLLFVSPPKSANQLLVPKDPNTIPLSTSSSPTSVKWYPSSPGIFGIIGNAQCQKCLPIV